MADDVNKYREKKPKACDSHITNPNLKSRYKNSKEISIEDLKYDPPKKAAEETGTLLQASDSFRDKQGTIGDQGKRVWVYPQRPKGRKYNARTIVSYILLAILVITPFIKVNGNPFMMFNIIERKFILFGTIFWPQDFIIFALSFLTIVLFIVFFTAAWGRIWCGWACPQTIFLEMVFRKIEYAIEGNANKQRNLDRLPWNREKILKKGSKHIIFYALSFLIGNLFLSYIIGVDELYKIITDPPSEHVVGLSAMIIFSGVFYFVFAWFREQACTFVCPYGRLQTVLLDKNSIVVAYDYKRGEPREKFSKKRDEDAGDCIMCKKCVQVCPTGIDIRNGTQMECINCTACMDACDAVMDKIGKPRGLIRYASEEQIEKGEKFRFTPRLKAYTGILTVLLGVITFLLVSRSNIDTRILRAKGQTYSVADDGSISNLYTMKIINKTYNPIDVKLDVPEFDERIQIVGNKDLTIQGNDVLDATFLLYIDSEELNAGNNDIKIRILKEDGELLEEQVTNFLTPRNLGGENEN